jgi:hypothetical protein
MPTKTPIPKNYKLKQEWLKLTPKHISFLDKQKCLGIHRIDTLTEALDRYMNLLERREVK